MTYYTPSRRHLSLPQILSVWEILKQNRGALIEGRATTYQDAVDAAIAAMKEEK